MIRTLMRIGWLNLKRDYVALALTFLLPILFFSIFAMIFGSTTRGGGMRAPLIAAVDLDDSEGSRRLMAALERDGSGLRVRLAPKDRAEQLYTKDEAVDLARNGKVSAALIFPPGFGEGLGTFDGRAVAALLYYDEANPVASHVVTGQLQRAAMTSAPDMMMNRGVEMLERFGEPLTPKQRAAVEMFRSLPASSDGAAASEGPSGGVVAVEAASVQRRDDGSERKSVIAFYAAGTGVMFLLFSMAGAGGTLLEEQESGALDRLLSSSVGMGRLLLAKWAFIAIMGAVQVFVMFLWGALVFDLDLFTPSHFAGFLLMTLVTASAAASFGMLLASACKSRAQLSGIATIIILAMSAVGGSMFPRFMMPEGLRKLGLLTFNGWALDGYLKVFWYDAPDLGIGASLLRLWPQVLVLALVTVSLLGISRWLVRRWETI